MSRRLKMSRVVEGDEGGIIEVPTSGGRAMRTRNKNAPQWNTR